MLVPHDEGVAIHINLLGLGDRYGDDAMKAAGEQLAKQAVSDKPIKPPSKK